MKTIRHVAQFVRGNRLVTRVLSMGIADGSAAWPDDWA
jgi:hypothetical protein